MRSKGILITLAIAALLVLPGATIAFQLIPVCGTDGPLGVTAPAPVSYSYVQTSSGSTTASFTVSSPPIFHTADCTGPPYVYGNGIYGPYVNINVSINSISIVSGPSSLTPDQEAALTSAFSFSPASFTLSNPGTGSQVVQLTFTNSSIVPLGVYDVVIDVKPETGTGVIQPDPIIFTVAVTAPVQEDTQAPDVTVNSPAKEQAFLLNAPLHVEFTANDPLESGTGTGVTAVRAFIEGCGELFNVDISNQVSIDPLLPIPADQTVTTTADTTANWIGSFTLVAQADDGAGHTGESAQPFTVGVAVASLPPISVSGRQFSVGSIVPIKWKITDYNNAFLAPFSDIKITIVPPLGSPEDRFAGHSATDIRWKLDDLGMATQYMTNYQIPEAGTYTVKVFVLSACGGDDYVEQGSFTFTGATKGGNR